MERDPFHELHLGTRFAYAITGIANLISKPKRGKGFKLKSFDPSFEQKEAKKKSPNALFTKMLSMTKMLGGKVIDKRGKSD